MAKMSGAVDIRGAKRAGFCAAICQATCGYQGFRWWSQSLGIIGVTSTPLSPGYTGFFVDLPACLPSPIAAEWQKFSIG
jgi:hypothetical protein